MSKPRTLVYSMPCKNCDSAYTGETGRTCAIRLAKHKRVQIWIC